MILVSTQGPNPFFSFFGGTFIRLGGLLDEGLDSDLDQGLTIVDNVAGIFTVPMSGTWTVSISFASSFSNKISPAYIIFNGEKISETAHGTLPGKMSSKIVRSNGDRKFLLKASAGDTISIQITLIADRTVLNRRVAASSIDYIMTCFEF